MEITGNFENVVQYLESLSIMPKEMPGIEKLKKALHETDWYASIDPTKVIVVAGTNGKGSTCAILESLLVFAGKRVGFYSSPHLIDTTERFRVQKKSISQDDFVKLFLANQESIARHQLTHFEALTLMAGDYFFSRKWNLSLDHIIFEVGLGGLYDATNAMPHSTSVITALSLDHTQILGSDLLSIAKNKFGIVQKNNRVIHHPLPVELEDLKTAKKEMTNSQWKVSESFRLSVDKGPRYWIDTQWGKAELNLPGRRAAENAALALTTMNELGYDSAKYLAGLKMVAWPGRMQEVSWPGMKARIFLSGDHNQQGVQSLIDLLKDYTYQKIHIIIGIGKDKDSETMLLELEKVPGVQLYLTETPFKGLQISEYPEAQLQNAKLTDANVFNLLEQIKSTANQDDLVVVTGSLYLVGLVLKKLVSKVTADEQAN